MLPVCLHDKEGIAAFLRRDAHLHLYELGDLDDFFWPYTTWYALQERGEIRELVLFYTGTSLPVLLALTAHPEGTMRDLLRSILPFLPRRFYAHLSGDLANLLAGDYEVEPHGTHHKMALTDPSRPGKVDTAAVARLTGADLPELMRLYEASYPGHWFDPRMLETGYYFGLRQGGELVSVAGIHVYAPHYRVAALGNVTTHPDFRGRGFAAAVCAALCQALRQTVDQIGLNVKADNRSAIALYEGLGFERAGAYEEGMFAARS